MVKNLPAMQATQVQSLIRKIPWRRAWQPTPVFLAVEFHGQRSLVGYSPRGCKDSDTTQQITLSLSLAFYQVGISKPGSAEDCVAMTKTQRQRGWVDSSHPQQPHRNRIRGRGPQTHLPTCHFPLVFPSVLM